MTRREAERYTQMMDTLLALGFTHEEAESLRRISMTLHRWAEAECNGDIERDETTGIPYRSFAGRGGSHHAYKLPDREKGAGRRLKVIMARHPGLSAYQQGDPRGAALYIIRPGDVPEGKDAGSYYSRGIAVY